MPGSLSHLGRRFFEYLGSEPLKAAEAQEVDRWLHPDFASIFFEQPVPDQRHGFEAACAVIAAGYDDETMIAAALLHDVGKRHAGLGVVGRSISSVLIKLGLPLTHRMTLYRDHGPEAAGELGSVGAPALVVDFARHHHGTRPSSISEDRWLVLQAADDPTKAGAGQKA